jgi:hypothetical protein
MGMPTTDRKSAPAGAPAPPAARPTPAPATTADPTPAPAREIGGRAGPDPTRFGDWEKDGRCIDF